jgi:Rrf2 family protein
VRVTAKVDYAVRAAIELAAAPPGQPVKGDQLAQAQDIPVKFLENILSALKRASLVRTQRGADGGYWLARPAEQITVADIVRAVEGPLANVRGEPPELVHYAGNAESLQRLWICVRANLRAVTEHVTLADLASGSLPPTIDLLADDPDNWVTR